MVTKLRMFQECINEFFTQNRLYKTCMKKCQSTNSRNTSLEHIMSKLVGIIFNKFVSMKELKLSKWIFELLLFHYCSVYCNGFNISFVKCWNFCIFPRKFPPNFSFFFRILADGMYLVFINYQLRVTQTFLIHYLFAVAPITDCQYHQCTIANVESSNQRCGKDSAIRVCPH